MPFYFGGAPDCDAHIQKAKPYHTYSMCAILVQSNWNFSQRYGLKGVKINIDMAVQIKERLL